MPLDIDDLIGRPKQTAQRRSERQTEAARTLAKQAAIKRAGSGGTFIEQGALKRPVSQNFLAEVFDMDPATVRKRLVRCPKLGTVGGQRSVYDFKTACQYLLPPKMTADEFIQTLNHAKLPPEVNKVFWQAQRERLRYLRDAGELWHTEDILALLGSVNMTFKDRMDLLVEDTRELKGISDAHVKKIEEMIHALKTDIYEALVNAPARGETLNVRDKEDPLAPDNESSNTEFDLGMITDEI